MLKIETFSAKGVKTEPTVLPSEFKTEKNLSLLAQAIRVYEENSHIGLADTKTRAEINRTKKKWYKQKGTGGARHGAKSAPIFVGGGSAHGPKPLRRVLSLPKKTVKKALFQALNLKLEQKEVVAVSGMEKLVKTKEASELLKKIAPKKRCLVVLGEKSLVAGKCLRNIEGVKVVSYQNLNAFNSLFGGVIIFDASLFAKETPVKVVKNEKKSETKTVKTVKKERKVKK